MNRALGQESWPPPTAQSFQHVTPVNASRFPQPCANLSGRGGGRRGRAGTIRGLGMAKEQSKWRSTTLSPLDIALDRRNPRINVTETDEESDIILKLLKHEEIVDLAKKIAKSGLLPGERIIVVRENEHYVVLEGNRRICACKLLLSPGLIPAEFKKHFPKLLTATELERIQKIAADVAPNRRSAEHILTLRHTEPGIRRWKPVARMRRVRRLLDEGFTIEEIAAEYNANSASIRKTIREYQLLRLAEQLKGLTSTERNALENPDLKTNPYTRFFELAHVREFLGLTFAANETPQIEPPRRAFDEKLKKIVRAFLVDPNAEFDTRTNPSEIFGREFATSAAARTKEKKKDQTRDGAAANGGSASGAKSAANGGGAQRSSEPKPDRFFESLECRVADNSLKCVVFEIRKINPDLLPISGTYLLRTLVELCLRYLIASAGKTYPGRADPTLTELVNYALTNRDVIFPAKRMADVIEAARSQKAFEYLNIVVHQKWMNADPKQLKSVANQLRNFIVHVAEART